MNKFTSGFAAAVIALAAVAGGVALAQSKGDSALARLDCYQADAGCSCEGHYDVSASDADLKSGLGPKRVVVKAQVADCNLSAVLMAMEASASSDEAAKWPAGVVDFPSAISVK